MGPKKEPPKLPPNVRVLHIDDGHADTVAEALRKIFPIMYADEKGRPQITIVAVADTVVVVSEDAKALDQAVEIARLLIRSEVPQCDYEVIALKHAKAADIVRIVDEIYNSKKNEKGERMERVRVVVDMQTNAMLLRGRELDRAAIRNFVTRTLDVPPEKK
jgi:type II secretory pathway component GspD/PulD (secretin)